MRNRTLLGAALMAAGAIALTGCGGVEKDATYEGVADLREAVVDSDFSCPGESVRNEGDEEEVLRCSGDLDLHVFTTEEAKQTGDVYSAIGHMMGGKSANLKGPNWMIQSDDAELLGEISDSLGGEVSVN